MYELIDKIRRRPGMYIGHESPTHLWAFLSGYLTGIQEENVKSDVPVFYSFHDWVAEKFGYAESTSGWAYMIEDQRIDKKEALWLFFDLLDEFRGIQHVKLAEMEYNQQFKLDTSWRGYCRLKKIRGTFKAAKKPRPARLIIKQVSLVEKWYSLVAVDDRNEVLDVLNFEALKILFEEGKRVFGVEQEDWK